MPRERERERAKEGEGRGERQRRERDAEIGRAHGQASTFTGGRIDRVDNLDRSTVLWHADGRVPHLVR